MKYFYGLLLLAGSASSFCPQQPTTTQQQRRTSLLACNMNMNMARKDTVISRKGFVAAASALATASIMIGNAQPALAIPMVTADELGIIMRDSPMSIQIVEFSGPKSETITVKLVDGTSFGVKDIIESSTDPRSPLKVAAACRENRVPAKFVNYESVLANAPKKKKLYTNERVQLAAEKEQAKKLRMEQDEVERLEALRQMGLPETQ
jgi:hypothetical protein